VFDRNVDCCVCDEHCLGACLLCDGVCLWWRPYDAHTQRCLHRAKEHFLCCVCCTGSAVFTSAQDCLQVSVDSVVFHNMIEWIGHPAASEDIILKLIVYCFLQSTVYYSWIEPAVSDNHFNKSVTKSATILVALERILGYPFVRDSFNNVHCLNYVWLMRYCQLIVVRVCIFVCLFVLEILWHNSAFILEFPTYLWHVTVVATRRLPPACYSQEIFSQ
jgi:hypothetical protein